MEMQTLNEVVAEVNSNIQNATPQMMPVSAPAPVQVEAMQTAPIGEVKTSSLEIMAAEWDFCDRISDSLIIPEAIRSTPAKRHTADVYLMYKLGKDLGLSFTQSLTGLYIIPGTSRPAMYTMTKRALVLKHGGRFVEERWDDQNKRAIVTIERNGIRTTRAFGVEQAVAMGKMFIDPNTNEPRGATTGGKRSAWSMDYRNMCLIRATARACDAAFPDVLMGLISVEESQDYFEPQPSVQNASDTKPAVTIAQNVNPALASAVKATPRRKKAEPQVIDAQPQNDEQKLEEPAPFVI